MFHLNGPDGEPIEGRELYATKVETDEGVAYETAWQPDDGERKALANGAPILLYAWGGYAPVALQVGEPDPKTMQQLYTEPHIARAFSRLLTDIDSFQDNHDRHPTPEEMLILLRGALAETRDEPQPDEEQST